MAYLTPKTDWDEDYTPSPEDMNRIEGNIKNLKTETTTIDGEKTFSQPINAPSINTGLGDFEIGQNLRTTDSVSFSSVNTGQGANELYAMDQDVQTTDAVTFTTVNTGQGNNELYPMNQDVRTSADVVYNDITANGEITPTSSTTTGSWNVLSTKTIPNGIYNISMPTTSILEIRVSTLWYKVAGDLSARSGCCIFSDGLNVRINGSGVTYYQKY